MIKITNLMRLRWVLKNCTILSTSRDGWTQRKISTIEEIDDIITKDLNSQKQTTHNNDRR